MVNALSLCAHREQIRHKDRQEKGKEWKTGQMNIDGQSLGTHGTGIQFLKLVQIGFACCQFREFCGIPELNCQIQPQ